MQWEVNAGREQTAVEMKFGREQTAVASES